MGHLNVLDYIIARAANKVLYYTLHGGVMQLRNLAHGRMGVDLLGLT